MKSNYDWSKNRLIINLNFNLKIKKLLEIKCLGAKNLIASQFLSKIVHYFICS